MILDRFEIYIIFFNKKWIFKLNTNVFVELVERVNDRWDVMSESNEFLYPTYNTVSRNNCILRFKRFLESRKTRSRHFIHYLARPANRSRNRGQVSREKPRVAGSRLVENHFPFSRLSRICDTIEQTFPWRVGWEIGVHVPPSSSV